MVFKDQNGRTPLSWAVESNFLSEAFVKLLVEKGANLESKDQTGRTPLSYAATNGREAIVEVFSEKGRRAGAQGSRWSNTVVVGGGKVTVPTRTANSGNGDIFFQISGPSSVQWIALGPGRRMAGVNIFPGAV